jgi:hypothetical protein
MITTFRHLQEGLSPVTGPLIACGYIRSPSSCAIGLPKVEQISLILFATDFEDPQSKTTASNARRHTPQSQRGPLHTPADVVAAVRNNTLVLDTKFNALVTLVKELVRERGYAKYETIRTSYPFATRECR